mgnify:CR=1 FL=1
MEFDEIITQELPVISIFCFLEVDNMNRIVGFVKLMVYCERFFKLLTVYPKIRDNVSSKVHRV